MSASIAPYLKSEHAIHHAKFLVFLYGYTFSLSLQEQGYVLFCIFLYIQPIPSGCPINIYLIEWVLFDRGKKDLGIKLEETGLNQAKVMKNYILESSFKVIRKEIKRNKEKKNYSSS